MSRIIDILKGLMQLREPAQRSVEYCDTGFSTIYERFSIRRKDKSAKWKDIKEIYVELRDCFTFHVFRLIFVDFKGKYVRVPDYYEGWEPFFDEVLRRYPTFNLNNYKKVEAKFPGEACLRCWRFDAQVEDEDLSTLGT